MKCPRCWTDKAYLRPVDGWKRLWLGVALLRPMLCRHCWHTFLAFWPLTWGKQVRAPKLRIAPASRSARTSLAAERTTMQARAARDADRADAA